MKKGGGSQSTIIIGPSKSVLVYALHSLEYVLGLARFRVFVPKLLLLLIWKQYIIFCHFDQHQLLILLMELIALLCQASKCRFTLKCNTWRGIAKSNKARQPWSAQFKTACEGPTVLRSLWKWIFWTYLWKYQNSRIRYFFLDHFDKIVFLHMSKNIHILRQITLFWYQFKKCLYVLIRQIFI